jgi:O-antigen ligase
LIQLNSSPLDASTRYRVDARDSGAVQQQSVMWTCFWALIAAWLPISRTATVYGLVAAPLHRVSYVVIAALLLSASLRQVARPVALPLWLSAAVVVPTAGFVSGHASSVNASVVVAMQFAAVCVLAPAVFRFHILHTRMFLPWVLGAFLVSQSLSSAAGLLQLTGVPVLGAEALFDRSTGFAGHPNTLGLMAAIALIVAAALLNSASGTLKAALWCLLLINGFALIATGSLSAMLAGVAGLAVLLVGRRRALAAILILAIAWALSTLSTVGSTWLFSFVRHRIAVVTGEAHLAGDASLEVRLLTYQWALEHISRDPIFGVGMDTLNSGTFNGVTEVHDFLLHAWYQGGLLLFVWFVAVTAVVLWGVVRSMTTHDAAGSAAVAAALIAFAATSAFFVQDQYWLPLVFAIAMFPTNKRFKSRAESTSSPVPTTQEL